MLWYNGVIFLFLIIFFLCSPLQDLKLALNGSEGRVEALEAQLARTEGMKRDLEYKLASIHSSLRRSIGFRQEDFVDGRNVRPRSKSPVRRPQSPAKGKTSSHPACNYQLMVLSLR